MSKLTFHSEKNGKCPQEKQDKDITHTPALSETEKQSHFLPCAHTECHSPDVRWRVFPADQPNSSPEDTDSTRCWHYLPEIASHPACWGLSPTRLPPLLTPVASPRHCLHLANIVHRNQRGSGRASCWKHRELPSGTSSCSWNMFGCLEAPVNPLLLEFYWRAITLSSRGWRSLLSNPALAILMINPRCQPS